MDNGLAQLFMFAKVIRRLSMFTIKETMVSLFTGNDSFSLSRMTRTPFILLWGTKVLFLLGFSRNIFFRKFLYMTRERKSTYEKT